MTGIELAAREESLPEEAVGLETTDEEIDRRIALWGRPLFAPGPGRDPEVLARPIPEPATAREAEAESRVDGVDLSIFAHKLDAIVDEGHRLFMDLAMAEALKAGDGGTSVFTARGDLVATATAVYLHCVLNYGAIKHALKHYADDPRVGVRDGDIFFFNENLSGGVHAFDMFVNLPVFYKGELVAWVGAGGHQGESGSKEPGGFCTTARSRYEEGLHITPLKIGQDFELRTDQLDVIANSVRTPLQIVHDIHARVAACMRMRQRVLDEIDRRGPDFVVGAMRRLLVEAGRTARERLLHLNDGVYRAVVFCDTVGVDEGLTRIPVTLLKRRDRMIVDLTGASPENRVGPFHTYWHLCRTAAAVFLFTHVFRDLPLSMGLLDPVQVIAPPSMLNASADVASSAASFVGRFVLVALHLAGSRLIFDSDARDTVCAPFPNNHLLPFYGGTDPAGWPVAGISTVTNGVGQGARHDLDGEHAMGFYWSPAVDCPGVEEQEEQFPWLFLYRNRVEADLHGFGRRRGGTSLTEVLTIHGVPSLDSGAVGFCDRVTTNLGLFGGYAAPPNPRLVIRDSNLRQMMARSDLRLPYGLREITDGERISGRYDYTASNVSAERLTEHDVLVISESGGGGYGDPLDREAEAVIEDLRAGVISAEVARDVYHVACVPDALTLDPGATRALREAERADRRRRGVPFREFLSGWSARRPPEAALRYYGDAPAASSRSAAVADGEARCP